MSDEKRPGWRCRVWLHYWPAWGAVTKGWVRYRTNPLLAGTTMEFSEPEPTAIQERFCTRCNKRAIREAT